MGPFLSLLLPFSFGKSPSVLRIRNFKQVSGPGLTAFSSGPQLERGHLLLERGANLRSTKLVHVKGKEKLFFIITMPFVIAAGGAGTFSLEPPANLTRSLNRSRPKFHCSASLFRIFARQGRVPGI